VKGQEFRSLEITIVFRIEAKLGFTHLHKSNPRVLIPAVLKGSPLVQPLKQVADRVTATQKGIEKVLVKTPSFQMPMAFSR